MLREVNQVPARRSKPNSLRQASALRATCLLCRVLWPIVVQHRHLIFDSSSGSSSEAKTVLLSWKPSRANRDASACSLNHQRSR